MHQPRTPLTISLLIFSILLTSVSAKEEWQVAHYGNFEFQSNLGEKYTDQIIQEFHYFAQTIERLFPKLGLMNRAPVRIVLTDDAQGFEDYSGGKLTLANTPSIWGSADGFEAVVVYIKNKRKPAQSSSVLFRAVASELFRDSDVASLWFANGISQLFSTVDITAYGNINIGKPIDLRFSPTPQSNVVYDTQPTVLTSHFLSAEEFFGLKKGTQEHQERMNRILLNIQSWICVHYAIFNEDPAVIQRLVQYATYCKNHDYSPDSFEKIMGVSPLRFMEELKSYAERGKFGFSELKKNDLPPYESVEIQTVNQERIDATQLALMLSTRNWEQSIDFLKKLNATSPNHPDVLEANYVAFQKIDTRWVEQKTIIDSNPDEELLGKATREFNRLAGYERQDLDTILGKALAAGVVNHHLSLTQAKRMTEQAKINGRRLVMKEIGEINNLLSATIRQNPNHLEALQTFVSCWSIAEKPAPDGLLPHIFRAMQAYPEDFTIWKSALIVFAETNTHQDSVVQIKNHLSEMALSPEQQAELQQLSQTIL